VGNLNGMNYTNKYYSHGKESVEEPPVFVLKVKRNAPNTGYCDQNDGYGNKAQCDSPHKINSGIEIGDEFRFGKNQYNRVGKYEKESRYTNFTMEINDVILPKAGRYTFKASGIDKLKRKHR